MNVNQYLDHCNEQNWQVRNEQSFKCLLNSVKSPRENAEKSVNLTSGEKPVLEARVRSLKESISHLKSELQEEKALWKKEVELMASLISNERSLEMTSEPEMDAKSVASVPILIREFEEKLNRYQEGLAQAHAEKRLNIRRQIAANTYRKRLNEVEKLCQEELNKVRETATHLEPLKQMASEWNKPVEATYQTDIIEQPRILSEKIRRSSTSGIECGGDFLLVKRRENVTTEDPNYPYEVPVKQIDASLVMDEDASNEIKGKIVLQIGSLPSEVPTICYSAKFE